MEKNRLILVTGATGFLGSYVVRLLVANGYKVRALRRVNSRMDLVAGVADRVEWAEADVTEVPALEDAFAGVTQVCHCAAMVSFHPRDRHRMHQVNVEGTANVVNLSLHHGVQKLVHVSSIAALGRTPERPQLDERSKWVESAGNSQYAISKYQSEQEAWRGWAEGLPVAIVNPSIILGSGFWDEGSARFFRQIDSGLKFWPVGRSGFVDVRDVARFIQLLLENDIQGERFILNADNVYFKEFFRLLAQAIDRPMPPLKVTPLLAEVAWRVEWIKEKLTGMTPMVTRESARSSVSKYEYLHDKSLTVSGFSYRPLETTIRETAAQFLEARKHGFKPMVLPL